MHWALCAFVHIFGSQNIDREKRQTKKQTYIHTCMETDRQTDRQIDRQPKTDTDLALGRQTDKETNEISDNQT